MAELRAADRRSARPGHRLGPASARGVLPAVEEAAEHTKVWWRGVMPAAAGGRGRWPRARRGGNDDGAAPGEPGHEEAVPAPPPALGVGPAGCAQGPPREFLLPLRAPGRGLRLAGAVGSVRPPARRDLGALAVPVDVERVRGAAGQPSDVAADVALGLASAAPGPWSEPAPGCCGAGGSDRCTVDAWRVRVTVRGECR